MFNKILASIGIGAAKVDTRIQNDGVRPGEKLKGEIYIQGGNVEQSISQIYLYLYTTYTREMNDSKVTQKAVLASERVANSFVIQPGERKIIPFEMMIPYGTPVSIGRQRIYLSTGLDIEMAMDPTDLDPVTVYPDPLVEDVLREMDAMGFQHSYDSGVCEYYKYGSRSMPFVQEFEFIPRGKFRGELDEVELIFDVRPDGVNVLMQVDKRARGLFGLLEEALEMDERYVRFFISRNDGLARGEIEARIRSAIRR